MKSSAIIQKIQDYSKDSLKQKLLSYYDDLKPTGPYLTDVAKVTIEAEAFVKEVLEQKESLEKKPAFVLDFDDTIVTHYQGFAKYLTDPKNDLKNINDMDIVNERLRHSDMPLIPPVKKLYDTAVDLGAEAFVISYRKSLESSPDNDMRHYILESFKINGIKIDNAHIFTPELEETNLNSIVYKTNIRKKLSEKGYNIIFTIGDQPSDVEGECTGKAFLIPNPLYGRNSMFGAEAHVTAVTAPATKQMEILNASP